MGTYASLQRFAEKTVKYKMQLHIDAAYVGKMISEAHYTGTVQRGACAALTAGWIAQQLKVPVWGVTFDRNKGVPSTNSKLLGNLNKQILASLAAPLQHEMVRIQKEYDGADYGWLATQVGLVVDWDRSGGDEFVEAMEAYANDPNNPLKQNEGIMLNYQATPIGKTPAECHTVGVCKCNGTNEIHFFDANIGAYKMKPGKAKDFATEYKRIIDQIPDWHVGPAVGYRVTPK